VKIKLGKRAFSLSTAPAAGLFLLVTCLAAFALGALPAGATVSGTNGKIVAGHVRHQPGSCYTGSAWQKRQGGISEMVSCGKQGLKGNREQFVKAVTRPVEKRAFLWQLAH